MGRIKTNLVKRTTKKFLSKYQDRFKPDFEENKKVLNEVGDIPSKKMRNTIAGYMSKLVKKQR